IFCPLFAFGVAYICFRGVTGTTAVNTAINVIQITALVVFSVIAVGYRLNHTQGSLGITLDPNGAPITKVIATDKDGKPVKDAQGNFVIAKGPDGKEQDFTIEYFAANYFLHNGYQVSNALGSAAPIGDMMIIVGTWLFGSAAAGKAFMLVQAFTVFLALVGTTLSCMSTGARVTYAMGRDEEV